MTRKPAMNVTVRLAAAPDTPVLLDHVAALCAFHDDVSGATAATLHRDLFGAQSFGWALLAEIRDQPAGFIVLTPQLRMHVGERALNIHLLYVDVNRRGTGIGRALLAAAKGLARAQGCTCLFVGADAGNTVAQATYTAWGFHPLELSSP